MLARKFVAPALNELTTPTLDSAFLPANEAIWGSGRLVQQDVSSFYSLQVGEIAIRTISNNVSAKVIPKAWRNLTRLARISSKRIGNDMRLVILQIRQLFIPRIHRDYQNGQK